MKRLLTFLLAAVVALSVLSVFATCDKRRCGDRKQEKIYSIEAAFETKIDNGNHNADVKVHKVVFKGNEALTDAVNSIIYDPFYSRYLSYSESAPVGFNFFRGENMIYENGELLSIASLSYRKGTYVVFPHIAGAVVDLKNNQLLTPEEVLQKFNTTSEAVAEEVRKILPEKIENTSPMIICDMLGAYLNADGELITIFSTEQVHVDMPANPTLYYNVTTKEICTYPCAESFEMLESLFSSLPEDYVFDEEKYNEYYSAYEEITARIPKYRLDVSEIKDQLAAELKDRHAPGKEITVTITTAAETDPYLWVNDEKYLPTDRTPRHTTFTFVMPNRDVKLKIEEKSADIPSAAPDVDEGRTEYKFEIPLEDNLHYIVPISIYGEIHPYINPNRYTPSLQTNEYSEDGVGYVTFAIAHDRKAPNVFSRYYTYRITQEDGCIASVEEVETITKETVLQNGTPFSGNPDGMYTGIAYDRVRSATVSGNEISVGSYLTGTDAGGTYTGTYSYDAETGDFSTELSFQYHDNGTFIINDPESISGKLYEYGGFIHFVCTSSNISTVDENEVLPMTFSAVNKEAQAPDDWKRYTEAMTADNGKQYEISFVIPGAWRIAADDKGGKILYDTDSKKRIGERVIQSGQTFDAFTESILSNPGGNGAVKNSDSPYSGVTDSGMEYIGYHVSVFPSAEKYDFLLQYTDDLSLYFSVWMHIGDTYKDFYKEIVLPVIRSVKISDSASRKDSTITDIGDWENLPWENEPSPGWKNAPNTYNFIYNLVSGESEIPEYNGLGIKDYSITLVEDEGSGIGTTVEFTFTVTGNSLPETLPPGTYTKIVGETVDVFLHDKEATDTKGLNKFGDNPAVQAVSSYLSWMPYIYEVSPFGEWDPENFHLPYNYICAYYGNENLEISFSELQRLMSEKFGIAVERPTEMPFLLSRCKYNAETDTIYYADTRGHVAVHRFLDIREEAGITYVIVQLFADQHFLLPSHKVQYAIGEGDVFLGCEIIQTGNYEPRELS